MGTIRAIWAEAVGLFVDDGALAVGVLLWVILCRLLLPWFGPALWPPLVLFFGLAALLAYGVGRRK